MTVRPAMETIAILSTGISSAMWMNSRFNAIDAKFMELDRRLIKIEAIASIRGLSQYPQIEQDVKEIRKELNYGVK